MTKRRFSSQQLYSLRNDIAVELLIEKTLSIPCRVTEGCFRFLCPLCNVFDTAVNSKTNLARCFRCEKNFNTIDLVMLIRQADFVQSVKFLQTIHRKTSVSQDHSNRQTISGADPPDGCRMKLETPSTKSDNSPCHIAKIVSSVLTPKHRGTSCQKRADYHPQKGRSTNHSSDIDRILLLEQKIEYLGRQIEKIVRTVNVGLPSK
jgi:hypothetical protein